MQLFADHWDISESAKERLYANIVTEHRLTACAPHPGTAHSDSKKTQAQKQTEGGTSQCGHTL